MKKYTLILALAIFSAGILNAQSSNDGTVSVENAVQTINLLPLSYAYEGKINDNSTYYLLGGVGFDATAEDADGGFEINTYLNPKLKAQYRSYYNLDSRAAKGKRTEMNTGNYWGGLLNVEFPPIAGDQDLSDEYSVVVAPMWGLQRNTSGRFSFNLNLGYGLKVTSDDVRGALVANMTLEFVLSSK